jgi:nucleoside-diphosphate-sugar epimerase
MRTALVVGGGAATGRAIIEELHARGYAVTVLNRGNHNDDLGEGLEFLVADPHFADSVRAALGRRQWDLTVVTYGRTRIFAEELRGRIGHLVTVSGMPVVRGYPGLPLREDDPTVTPEEAPAAMQGLIEKIVATEQAVLSGSALGHYRSTVVRYPYVYGPHSVVPMEWHVVRRCLDGRRQWLLRDGGLAATGHCASKNAGGLVGAIVDQPAVATGRLYHAADERQLSQREWVELIAELMGHEFEYVDVPSAVARPGMSCAPLAGEDPFASSVADIASARLRHHVPSAERARTELGYCEQVEPAAWLRETLEFLLAHPPATDGTHASFSPLDFDYAAEDQLLAWWRTTSAEAPTFGTPVARGHAYEHPKSPTRARTPDDRL